MTVQEIAVKWIKGRSPYGERGLKYGCMRRRGARRVALLTESVD